MSSQDVNFVIFWKNHKTGLNMHMVQSAQNLADEMAKIAQDSPYTQTFQSYEHFCESVFNQQLNSATHVFQSAVLLKVDNHFIGFLNARIAYNSIDIDFTCIAKEYRFQGYGQLLFDKFEEKLAEEFSEKNIQILLEVSTQNKTAIQFYKKIGFTELNIRKKYYANGEDAIVMQKE